MKNLEKFDLIAVGECLVDFFGGEDGGRLRLEGNPGGAPANVLAMAARLGLSCALAAKVGDDGFGRFLRARAEEAGVDCRYLATSPAPTTLAMVTLDASGDRSFGFYRSATADVLLEEGDIPFQAIEGCRALHFGSVSLVAQPARGATLSAARHAKAHGVPVSFDPNYRPALWDDPERARQAILEGLALADWVKLSEEELVFLTGKSLEPGMEQLWREHSFRLMAVTRGPEGCVVRSAAGTFSAATFAVPTVDTTGAGDAFWGAMLVRLLTDGEPDETPSPDRMAALLDFANAAGALTTGQKGAIPAMPCRAEIEACLKGTPRLRSR